MKKQNKKNERLSKKKCPVCKKEFLSYKKKRSGQRFRILRPFNSKTCSKECAREYSRKIPKKYQRIYQKKYRKRIKRIEKKK